MRVVVTGGAGFIGANLCRALAARSVVDEVVAFDDLSTGFAQNLDGETAIALVEGTILDPDLLKEVTTGAGAIVHLAARPSVPRSLADPFATHEVNATGTIRVLEAARANGVPHVVVASSSSVYGSNPAIPKREDLAPMPSSPYAASKLVTESYALSYGASFDLDVLALRLFNVFGPLQAAGHAYAAAIPVFVSAALARRPLPVFGDGCQTRDFTYVSTVVEVFADAVVNRVKSPTPVNLALGNRVSLLDLIALLEKILERELAIEHLEPRRGEVRDSQADSSALLALFPGVQPVALEIGLRETIEWLTSVRMPPPGHC